MNFHNKPDTKAWFAISRLLLFLPILFLAVDSADCAEQTYYSIHLASFKELQNANSFVNNLTKKGKMVFWKKTDVLEKGIFYRVYLGKYKDRDRAVEFWKHLRQEGAVSYFGVHEFEETIRIEDKEEVVAPPAPPAVQPVAPVPIKGRFVDNRDGTVSDTETNLMWIKNGWRIDFVSAVRWPDAVRKCEKFRHAGYGDWRLPTVKEWKSLMDTQKEYPALIEPNPFENIIVHMPYWSKTEYSPGPGRTASLKNPTRAYTVMLYYGRINHQSINKRAFILPVRAIKSSPYLFLP